MSLSRRLFLASAGAGAAGLGIPAARAAKPAVRLLSTYVAGSDRYAAPVLIHQLSEGTALDLRREPANRYDPRAVSVWTTDDQQKLGYVPRIHNQALASLMDAGISPEARIDGIKGSSGRPDIAISVSCVLAG